ADVFPDQVEAGERRHDVVDDADVERALGQHALPLAGVRRFEHFVAGVAKRAAECLQNLFLVVDEQNGPAVRRHQLAALLSGRSMCISVPWPAALLIAIEPPRPSMMFFAIGRPRPVPPRLVVKYGSNTRPRSTSLMP